MQVGKCTDLEKLPTTERAQYSIFATFHLVIPATFTSSTMRFLFVIPVTFHFVIPA